MYRVSVQCIDDTYPIIDTIHKPTEYACVQARKCSGFPESAALFTKKATGVFMHLPIAASCSQAQERNALWYSGDKRYTAGR